MSSLEFAQAELKAIGMLDSGNEMNDRMGKNILELVDMFARQGHSGFSAGYCINILIKLLKYEPISPLTGDDSEWIDLREYEGEILYQNKRCFFVFKDEKGAYSIQSGCRIDIEFPYTPINTIVKEDEECI